MPLPVRNPFAPPPSPPPPPKPRKSKSKREEKPLKLSAEEAYEQQLAVYERAKGLVKVFLVYYDSVFDNDAAVVPTSNTVIKLLNAEKDNMREFYKICTDERRGFDFPKSYFSVLLQVCRLTNMAIDAKLVPRKDFSPWLPGTDETEALVKRFEDYDFHHPLPPPVRPRAATPPPVASSSKGSKRKALSSTLDISDSESKPSKRSKIQVREDSSSEDGEESEEVGDEDPLPHIGGWSFEDVPTPTIGASKKHSSRRRSPSPATVTVRHKPEAGPSKPKAKHRASAPKPKGKEKATEREKVLAAEVRGPRLDTTIARVQKKISDTGERSFYQPPVPPHIDEDDGFVNEELSTAGGHVYLQGNVQLSYDTVVEASTIAPEPNFYTQGCDRCIQKGLGCSPRPDGHAGCTGCKSTNQKCSFTQSLEETLAARDEQFDLGLQGHNGLVFQLDGILGTLGSLLSALDIEFQARQQALRLNRVLERQRLILQRSTRDPRVICALLRILHPHFEALTPERLLILLTALKIPHSSFDITAAGFRVDGKDISVIDKASRKILASKFFISYQQVVSLAESAYPPVNLAKWLEARVGPEYVIKDKAAPEDTPGSPMAQDSKLEGSSTSPSKASTSAVKTPSPRSILDVPPSTSNIKDSKVEKKLAGSKSPMVVEKVGGSSSGDVIKDKSPREQAASSDSDSE
ncbi:hypothetical protein VNI00_019035 [Paramarasmius palmivorus]|uniref:Zn(2)-C6 fungal-type domain-containing protein n=1 Tax=Paramarasmius palmivorus TaxID=297713 RepID=A0AAW0AR59_9AGAR